MPELHVRWAYPLIWIAMIAVAAGMLVFFWRKGWLGGKDSGDGT
jgi:magnesium transporter